MGSKKNVSIKFIREYISRELARYPLGYDAGKDCFWMTAAEVSGYRLALCGLSGILDAVEHLDRSESSLFVDDELVKKGR